LRVDGLRAVTGEQSVSFVPEDFDDLLDRGPDRLRVRHCLCCVEVRTRGLDGDLIALGESVEGAEIDDERPKGLAHEVVEAKAVVEKRGARAPGCARGRLVL